VHATTACATCHNPPYAPSANNYTTVPTSCYGCHVRDFNGAASPVPHTGFPTTCDSCHKNTDAAWSQKSAFSHAAYFSLVGPHATAPCAQCHNPPYAPSANNYLTVPTSCYGCHQKDFTGATSPVPHTGFATTCDSCHRNTDATWSQKSAFNHAAYFPLAGAHTTAPCAQCHTNGNYLTVPASPCSACHMNDYNTATTPVNHIVAGFPTTCDTCHKFSDVSWTQAVWNHTWFPLVSNHNVACNRCHTTAGTYTVFNCIGCHTQAQTNSNHTGVRGYVWASPACYSCHPNGRAG
jgi:predicted CXXCH cytochrome family protein